MAEYSIVSILPVLSKLAAKHYSAERPSFVLETSSLRLHVRPLKKASPKVGLWFELRGQDLNLRPRGYETDFKTTQNRRFSKAFARF